ncbi:UBLE1B [Mytilus coruscus]|uniref:UBLE1B n=1 Tax=Mytilus coruscus TaxID=42192 RepID=A0A6J8CZV0_MYTCO|nr:UBLE1B [Mytilus coruscus]
MIDSKDLPKKLPASNIKDHILENASTVVHHCKLCNNNNNNPTVTKAIQQDAVDLAIDLLEDETQLDINYRGANIDACDTIFMNKQPYNMRMVLHYVLVQETNTKSTQPPKPLGITVLPVMEKIIETIMSNRITPKNDRQQCNLQRGLKKTAPINAGLIMEESRTEALDLRQDFIIIFLDAKSAFDVVMNHTMMLRLSHLGIQDRP